MGRPVRPLRLLLALAVLLGPGSTTPPAAMTPLNGVLGESVTLPLQPPVDKGTLYITWLHNGVSLAFIQRQGAQNQVTPLVQTDRLNFTESCSLQITNLTMADTGHYRAQISTETQVIYNYRLSVFRRLRNLQVANDTQLSENRTCEVRLACSVETPADNVSIRWQVSGNTLSEGANLSTSWDPASSGEQTYTCVAENPVSRLVSSLSARSLCQGVFHGRTQSQLIVWIAAAVVSVLAVVAVVCLVVWRRCSTGSWSFSPQRPQSPAGTLRNTEYDPLPPGSTVYAQVTHTCVTAGSSTPAGNYGCPTIYSAIHQPRQLPLTTSSELPRGPKGAQE